MEFFWQFVFALVAASIGFLIHRKIGFNIAGIFTAIPLIFLLMPFVILTITAPSLTISQVTSSLNLYLTNFAAFLPSLIIGHVAGAFAGALFGNNGTFSRYQIR
jgi:hypothetical protein